MKKIIVLLMMVGSLFISGNSLFADDFDDCFELERLRAKSDGLGAVESAEQASKVCKAKLGGTQRQTNTTPNYATRSNTSRGKVFIGGSSNLSGSAKLRVTCTGDCSQSNISGDPVDIDNGLGLKVGYKFSSPWRVSYNSYTWELKNRVEITSQVFIVDFATRNGFYIGLGLGSGELTRIDGSKSSGNASIFNTGVDFSVSENVQVGFGILSNSVLLDSARNRGTEVKLFVDTFSTFVGVNILF